MSLYKQWVDLMEGQTDETFEAFWKEYSETETRIYEHILAHKNEHLKGKYSVLVEQFKADPVILEIPVVGISEGATYLSKRRAISMHSLLAASMPSTSDVGSASANPFS